MEIVSDILEWSGIALMLMGMFVTAISGASIRPRPILGSVGGILILAGMFLPGGRQDEPWMFVIQILGAGATLYLAVRALWHIAHTGQKPAPRPDAQS